MKKLVMYHCGSCEKLVCMKEAPEHDPVCCGRKMSIRNDGRWETPDQEQYGLAGMFIRIYCEPWKKYT